MHDSVHQGVDLMPVPLELWMSTDTQQTLRPIVSGPHLQSPLTSPTCLCNGTGAALDQHGHAPTGLQLGAVREQQQQLNQAEREGAGTGREQACAAIAGHRRGVQVQPQTVSWRVRAWQKTSCHDKRPGQGACTPVLTQ